MSTLTVRDKQVLSWIEVTYHDTKNFPTSLQIQASWPKTFPTVPDVDFWCTLPHIKQALSNRGLSTQQTTKPADLSPLQAAALLVVANLSDRRSLSAKLKSIGATLTQWNAWKKQPAFKKLLHSQLTDDFDTSLDRALSGLLKSVDAGNPRAVEIYMELTGRQPTENERNYKLAISRIVECITRHVKDPQTRRLIAEDFDKIERGIDPAATINSTVWHETPNPVVITSAPHSSSLGDTPSGRGTLGDAI
jgi:hypothetical protein